MEWDDTNKILVESDTPCTDYTTVTDSISTSWGSDGTETWYVVNSDVTIGNNDNTIIMIKGNVHLILCDGATLTFSGSGIWSDGSEGNLTIYGQNAGTGALTLANNASNAYIRMRNLTINGGIVTAESPDCPSSPICGTESITINGGTVTAIASIRGISSAKNIIFNGGTVKAKANPSEHGSCGICAGGNVEINSGRIETVGDLYGIYANEGNGDVNITNVIEFTASGNTKAILGKIKNKIAGTGWTDKEGIQGETVIEKTPLTPGRSCCIKKFISSSHRRQLLPHRQPRRTWPITVLVRNSCRRVKLPAARCIMLSVRM